MDISTKMIYDSIMLALSQIEVSQGGLILIGMLKS